MSKRLIKALRLVCLHPVSSKSTTQALPPHLQEADSFQCIPGSMAVACDHVRSICLHSGDLVDNFLLARHTIVFYFA